MSALTESILLVRLFHGDDDDHTRLN